MQMSKCITLYVDMNSYPRDFESKPQNGCVGMNMLPLRVCAHSLLSLLYMSMHRCIKFYIFTEWNLQAF